MSRTPGDPTTIGRDRTFQSAPQSMETMEKEKKVEQIHWAGHAQCSRWDYRTWKKHKIMEYLQSTCTFLWVMWDRWISPSGSNHHSSMLLSIWTLNLESAKKIVFDVANTSSESIVRKKWWRNIATTIIMSPDVFWNSTWKKPYFRWHLKCSQE